MPLPRRTRRGSRSPSCCCGKAPTSTRRTKSECSNTVRKLDALLKKFSLSNSRVLKCLLYTVDLYITAENRRDGLMLLPGPMSHSLFTLNIISAHLACASWFPSSSLMCLMSSREFFLTAEAFVLFIRDPPPHPN